MSASPGDFCVGILNYRTKDILLENLHGCIASGVPPDRILVWDNASGDGSPTAVAERFPGVRCVASEKNLGYAGGMNGIVGAAGTSRVVLVTADCFATWAAIQQLLEGLGAGIALVGCRILDRRTARIQSEGGDITYPLGIPLARRWQRDVAAAGPGVSSDVGYLDGAILAVDRSKFAELGGFDASYFAYEEDVDLCWRARMAGYRVVCVGSAEVVHATSVSFRGQTSFRWVLTERNRMASNLKNLELPHLGISLLCEALYAFALVPGAARFGMSGYARAYAKALLGVAAGLRTVLAQRKVVQHRRRLPDRVVLASHPRYGFLALANALSERAELARRSLE